METIRRVKHAGQEHWPLLLLADPSVEMINRYLPDGELWEMRRDDGGLLCVAVVSPVSSTVCELKNLAVTEGEHNRGIGGRMLEHLLRAYASRYGSMLVGTSNSNPRAIIFYVSHGFRYVGTLIGFFTDHYPEPIIEEGIPCVDMLMLKRPLTNAPQLALRILPQEWSVCRLPPACPPPETGPMIYARIGGEWSLVCESGQEPADIERSEPGWRAMRVEGQLDFGLVGILAQLTGVLACAQIPVFAVSTFDTDYLLVKKEQLDAATAALSEAGHRVLRDK